MGGRDRERENVFHLLVHFPTPIATSPKPEHASARNPAILYLGIGTRI